MAIAINKIDRASEEIELLDQYIRKENLLNQNKAKLDARYNADSGKHEIYLSNVPNLDELRAQVSITVSAIVHWLRSALDNMVYERALVNTNDNIQNAQLLQFPIIDSQSDFDTVGLRQISELSTQDQTIIESFQPYHGVAGRPDSFVGPFIHQLSLLRDISNTDKHREIVNISVDPNSFETNVIASPILDSWRKWTVDNPIEYFRTFKPVEMRVGRVTFEAVVDGKPLKAPVFAGHAVAHFALDEGRSLIATLRRIESYVRKLVVEVYD